MIGKIKRKFREVKQGFNIGMSMGSKGKVNPAEVVGGLLMLIIAGFLALIFTGNLAPVAQEAITSNESYTGQVIVENAGMWTVIGGLIVGLVGAMFAWATDLGN